MMKLTTTALLSLVACWPALADVTSSQSGAWESSGTWNGQPVPDMADHVTIATGHTVTINADGEANGIVIETGATLRFDPLDSVLLETDANVVVDGTLEMRAGVQPHEVHTLRFVYVAEGDFQGGHTTSPVASDVGLWCFGACVLDIVGAEKTGWTKLAGGAEATDTSIELADVPTGWRAGDTIVIVPTEHPSVGSRFYTGFEERTIQGISGAVITLNSGLSHDHPAVDDPFSEKTYTAEVMNLTRNVRIEGTGNGSASLLGNGRAHIFIDSDGPQTIKWAELVLLGPRAPDGNFTDTVLGRYPLHFHMNHDDSRGSLVEGVVVRDSGNRAFVPHASHGITIRDTVAYDVWEDAYWWDASLDNGDPDDPHNTDDLLIEHAIAALMKDDPAHRGYRISGFDLKQGEDGSLSLIDSVAVGVQGNEDASGYEWPEKGQAVWVFEDNIAHNNKVDGIFVWQNDSREHIVADTVLYRNGEVAVDHGAYTNVYQYLDVTAFENGDGAIALHALSRSQSFRADGYSQAWEGFLADGPLNIFKHTLAHQAPTLFKDCVFDGVVVNEPSNEEAGLFHFVNCLAFDDLEPLEPGDFTLNSVSDGTLFLVQDANCTAWQMTHTGAVSSISPFYSCDAPADTEAPSTPANVAAVAAGTEQIDLSWNASTDNVGVIGYRIYRDSSFLVAVSGTSHSDTGLTPDTAYSYQISAVDAAENESQLSVAVQETTDATGGGALAVVSVDSKTQKSTTWSMDLSGVASGHLMLMVIEIGRDATWSSIPSGWATVAIRSHPSTNRNDLGVFSKTSNGSEGSPSWTVASVASSNSGGVIVIDGAGSIADVDHSYNGESSSGSTPSVDGVDGGLLLSIVGTRKAPSLTKPGSMTLGWAETWGSGDAAHSANGLSYEALDADGATGTRAWSFGLASHSIGLSVVIAP